MSLPIKINKADNMAGFNKAKKILPVVLMVIILLSLSMMGAPVSKAAPQTSVSIAPPSQTVPEGQSFTADVYVVPDTAIRGAQFDLAFDPFLLTCTGVTEGDLFYQGPGTTFWQPPVIDNGAGTITSAACAIIGAAVPMSNPGTFATIAFTAKNVDGTSPLNLSNVIVGDMNGNPVSITVTSGSATAVSVSDKSNDDDKDQPPRPAPGITDVSNIVTDKGVFIKPATAQTQDGLCKIIIDKGTIGLTRHKKPLSEIIMTEMEETPALPEYAHRIGLTYNLGPDGATFEPPATLIISYELYEIPEGVAENDLVVARWDTEAGEWVELVSTVDPSANTTRASVEHFTAFTIFGYESASEPALFSVGSLDVAPTEVDIGETVTISLLVANAGSEAGSYKVVLKINGTIEASKHVAVNASSTEQVSFTTSKDVAGIYTVDANGLTCSFKVREKPAPPPLQPVKPINWLALGGTIAGVVVVGLLIFFLVRRRSY